MPLNMSARDGSTTDIVAFWVTKLMAEHKRGYRVENEAAIYFALISHSAHSLCALHRQRGCTTDYYEKLSGLLADLRIKLYEFSPSKVRNELNEAGYEDPEPRVDNPAWHPAWQVKQYWEGDRWREDFFDTINQEFWNMKDYAHGAGERKSDFLWNLAEVWVAAATSALVHYAPDDRERWSEVASMVRHFADQIEEDGLRSLKWGAWGRKAKGK
jgi:hypothetical protein